MTGAFDGPGEGALVLRAISRNSSSDDFSFFGQKFTEAFHIFVIDGRYFLRAKTAAFFPEEPTPRAAWVISVSSSWTGTFIAHGQKGTSSSGESSSLEISRGAPFFGEVAAAGSSGSGSSGS